MLCYPFRLPTYLNIKLFRSLIMFLTLIGLECLQSIALATASTPHLDTDFKIVPNWPDSSVSSLNFYGSAVTIYPRSELLVVLHRSNSWEKSGRDFISDDTVFILDKNSGKILGTWGKGLFVKPHGIEISPNGDLFVTDLTLHQVFKFADISNGSSILPNWSSSPELILGERFISGNDKGHFCAPTDVAVVKDSGEFFVSDGYCNSRVIKFANSGEFIMEFGAGNSALLYKAFNVPHAIAIYSPVRNSNEESLIFVADRNNGRIQSFTLNGTFVFEIGSEVFSLAKDSNVTMLFSIAFTFAGSQGIPGAILHAVTGKVPLGRAKVYQILIGGQSNYKVISEFSIRSTESIKHSITNTTSVVFETPHDLVVNADGSEIWIVEAAGKLTLWKFTNNYDKDNDKSSSVKNGSVDFILLISILIYCVGCILLKNNTD